MQSYQHQVQYYETDSMGITNHTNYIRFMEEARSDFLRQIGWPYDQFEKHGIISPVVNINCQYRNTTTFPDLITIKVKVNKISKVKLALAYVMTVKDHIVCTATSEHCFLTNDEHKIINIKTQLPEFYNTTKKLIQ